jgi:hypothetical protein
MGLAFSSGWWELFRKATPSYRFGFGVRAQRHEHLKA